jgi:hypothetical protein
MVACLENLVLYFERCKYFSLEKFYPFQQSKWRGRL